MRAYVLAMIKKYVNKILLVLFCGALTYQAIAPSLFGEREPGDNELIVLERVVIEHEVGQAMINGQVVWIERPVRYLLVFRARMPDGGLCVYAAWVDKETFEAYGAGDVIELEDDEPEPEPEPEDEVGPPAPETE